MELKIIEWNVQGRDIVGKKYEDTRKKIFNPIKELKADVVVLTEVGATYRYYMERLSDQYFAVGSNNGGNGNNIIIAVSSEKIERVLFEDYYIYPTSKNELGRLREHEKRNHPDRLLAKVKLKKSNNWLKILGIRMMVSGFNNDDEREDQEKALKYEIKDADYPDVIIGDFNWISAFKPYNEDKPKEFEEYIKEKQYEMFPSSLDKDSVSFWTKNNSDKHTSPDRVLYKKELVTEALVTEAPDIKPDKNHHYYHQELNKYKPYDNFDEGWPSDHDILVVTVTIPDKK